MEPYKRGVPRRVDTAIYLDAIMRSREEGFGIYHEKLFASALMGTLTGVILMAIWSRSTSLGLAVGGLAYS